MTATERCLDITGSGPCCLPVVCLRSRLLRALHLAMHQIASLELDIISPFNSFNVSIAIQKCTALLSQLDKSPP